MVSILIAFITQALMTVGVIFLFGFLIAQCNKFFYSNMGAYGQKACYITGFIGTPVHECAHALFCVIFGHKITEIKLFQINSDDGTLGYVNHSYNPKNLYHKIGNFFIGIAPITVISSILALASHFLVPKLNRDILRITKRIDIMDSFDKTLENILDLCIVNFSHCDDVFWWIFVVVGAFLALHMTLSTADIKGAMSGLGIVLAFLLVMDIFLYLAGVRVLANFTNAVALLGGYLTAILTLSLIISVIALAFSIAFKVIMTKLLKR